MVHGHPGRKSPTLTIRRSSGLIRFPKAQGAQQAGMGQKFDLLFPSAGGQNKISGDYLYTTYQTANKAGTWGLFRVTGKH